MTTITRGVNKGKLVKAWKAEPTTDLWACVVSHYQKGISAAGTADADWNTAEQAALTTARLAHILQHGDYEPVEEGAYRISPWSPERIKTQ
jgi:DNA polymerase-1